MSKHTDLMKALGAWMKYSYDPAIHTRVEKAYRRMKKADVLVLERVDWEDVAIGERVYEKYPSTLIPQCKLSNPVHSQPVPKHQCYRLPEDTI